MNKDTLLSMLDRVPAMIGHVEPNLSLRFVNAACLARLNTSAHRTPKSFSSLLGPQLYAQVEQYVEPTLRGIAQSFTVAIPDGDGAVTWSDTVLTPDVDSDGQNICGFYFSICERPPTPSDLRLGALLKRLYELGPNGVSVIDGSMRYVAANSRFCEMLGYTESELLGKFVWEITVPEDMSEDERLSAELFSGDSPFFELEKRFLHKDGHIVHGRITATVPSTDSEGWGIALVEDITQKKDSEERLLHAYRLAALGELTGGLAHDFNNLLAVILGNLNLATTRLQSPATDNQQTLHFISSAISAADRGAALIQRLLAFSRKQTLEPEALDANAVVASMGELVSRTIEENITLDVIKTDSSWRCLADRAQLESAILNLAINARDAMPNGGTLTLSCTNITLDEAHVLDLDTVTSGEYVMITLTDTGEGMTSDTIRRSVEPFFTTKGVGEGSGLGLSMVYGFVKQSKGHISIVSVPTRGTTVKLYLPRTEVATSELSANTPEPELPGLEGRTVLLVEDDLALRELTEMLLRELGLTVFSAPDGQAAADMAETLPQMDLLLTDVILPGTMSGPTLAKWWRARDPNIRVLFASGYSETPTVRDARVGVAAPLLHKPYRLGELEQKIRQALRLSSNAGFGESEH